MLELATELDQLQYRYNERGISALRGVVSCLKRGAIAEAKAICFNESDKLDYPEIKRVLITKLFEEKNHPWVLFG